MSSVASAVRRHPLIPFFVLAYAISWILESPLVLLRDSLTGSQGFFLSSSRPTSLP
jgi:hypothetical protein